MFNVELFEKKCPKCSGFGRIENPNWTKFWIQHGNLKDWFRTLDLYDQKTIAKKMLKDEPVEPMFFFCKECSGKGKILTAEGKKFIDFIKFWLNDNY